MKKEVVFESIKWSDKSPDEIYQYFSKLNAVEQLRLLKLLCHQYPDIEIDWLDIFEELRFHLSYVDNIAACEEFVQWFPEHHYEEYSRGFEFIERDLCDYYLKIGNLERLRQRIRFISQHPVSGIDTITIRLYFQLLYHGLYEDAINYAKAVAQPIENAEGLWGNPETNFVQGLYLNSLQKAYESYQLTGHAVYSAVFIQAAQLGLEENKKIFDIEQKALTGSLIPAEVLDRVNTEFEHCMIELNVHFLKYMFDNYKIPFMLSEVLWTIVGVKNLFGKSKRIKDFFYVDIKTFETILTKRVDYLLGSNSLEMFGKTWALHYIYEFLEENRLISTEAANQMRENNLYHRNEMICYVGVELWQMSFVFNWPQNHLWSDLQTLFESTYGKSGDESRNILKEFSEMNPPSQRIREEIKSTEPKKHTGKISLKENQTYQKSTPDTGRNDPCPCGSGKKYKNCCLKI